MCHDDKVRLWCPDSRQKCLRSSHRAKQTKRQGGQCVHGVKAATGVRQWGQMHMRRKICLGEGGGGARQRGGRRKAGEVANEQQRCDGQRACTSCSATHSGRDGHTALRTPQEGAHMVFWYMTDDCCALAGPAGQNRSARLWNGNTERRSKAARDEGENKGGKTGREKRCQPARGGSIPAVPTAAG